MSAPTTKKPPAKSSKLSSTRDLVPVGAQHLSSKYEGRLRTANGERPTTARALVLRNGKYGARGTGELMSLAPSARMTGREKMDLLAEDLIEKSKTAVQSPFRLEHCLQIAESEYNDYIDNIKWLKDPDVFYDIIKIELISRTHKRDIKQLANPSHQAAIVSTVIHNAYTFASAWQLIYATLQELKDIGVTDKDIKFDLANNTIIRTHYMNLYAYVNKLIELAHTHLSILAMTNPHYASYVTKNEYAAPDEPDMIFDKQGLRTGARSFIDSIIIELLFPNSPYPKYILYSLLHDAVAESRKDVKRFSQPLWDAIGKLSELLKLQEILERPLKGPEGEKIQQLPIEMPEEYEDWVDAQLYSLQASQEIGNFKDLINPLTKTKRKEVLNRMWDCINENYIAVSGEDIDSLWMLDGAFDRTPTWHCVWTPAFQRPEDELKSQGPKKQLVLKNYAEDGEQSDSSMPELQSVSESSDEEDEEFIEDEDYEYEEIDEEDGYDTEEEDELRDLYREAMDAAFEAGFFGPDGPTLKDEQLAEDRKGNPFLKLLGSLRGRVFSSNPKLSTQERKEPRKGYKPRPFSKPTTTAPPKPGTQPLHPKAQQQAAARAAQSQKTTMEEVEDEDDQPSGPKKKKKKPKKKKRTSTENAMEEAFDAAQTPSSPPPTSPSLPQSPKSPRSSSTKAATENLHFPLERTTTAQSAHSYLSENAPSIKQKVKSRTAQPTLFSTVPEETKTKSGFLSRFKKKREEAKPTEDQKGARKTWFNRLTKRTASLMDTLLRPSEMDGRSSMKWEDFLRVMREMGFTFDPSTAGSSVRFDPPNSKDKSITFHKPHPDPTLSHLLLKKWGRRLKDYYGWDERELLRYQ